MSRDRNDMNSILEALGEVGFRFWVCPVDGHSDRTSLDGRPVVTVEWRGGIAHCTADGCDKTSAPSTEEKS